MAKWIEYNYVCNANKGIFLRKKVAYNEVNLAIAKVESYNGSYTITDDNKDMEVNPIAINIGGTGACNVSDARKNLEVAQAIESADHPGCYYKMCGDEMEWLNPPMQIGTEYRTTERFDACPVYTVVVAKNVGDAIIGVTNFKYTLPSGLVNELQRFISWTNTGAVLPVNLTSPDDGARRVVQAVKGSEGNTINGACYAGQNVVDANEMWYIQLWYTKMNKVPQKPPTPKV